MHLNCKKQEFAIQILASKSQLIDLNILTAPIKIVEVLQQMEFFFIIICGIVDSKKPCTPEVEKKAKSLNFC